MRRKRERGCSRSVDRGIRQLRWRWDVVPGPMPQLVAAQVVARRPTAAPARLLPRALRRAADVGGCAEEARALGSGRYLRRPRSCRVQRRWQDHTDSSVDAGGELVGCGRAGFGCRRGRRCRVRAVPGLPARTRRAGPDVLARRGAVAQRSAERRDVQPAAGRVRRVAPTGRVRRIRWSGGSAWARASANPSFAAAIEACASVRPSGGAGRTISAATFAAFASCMSDNGVTITGTDPQAVLRGLNRNDAKTAAALKVCHRCSGRGPAVPGWRRWRRRSGRSGGQRGAVAEQRAGGTVELTRWPS